MNKNKMLKSLYDLAKALVENAIHAGLCYAAQFSSIITPGSIVYKYCSIMSWVGHIFTAIGLAVLIGLGVAYMVVSIRHKTTERRFRQAIKNSVLTR